MATPFGLGFGNNQRTGQAQSIGLDEYAREGRVQSDAAWGGWQGNVSKEGDQWVADNSVGGRQEDVDRYRGMADAAAQRRAVQNNYASADIHNRAALQARGFEGEAAGLYGQAARGEGLQSQALGRQMIQGGLDAQRAAALGTTGGGLAQVAALRAQQAGQGAFAQGAGTQLDAIRAQEMAQARTGLAGALSAQRAGDYASQGLNQAQAKAQMDNELRQRALNQAGQLGYEGLAFDVNRSAMDAQMQNQQLERDVNYQNQLVRQQDAKRDARLAGMGMAMGGAVLGAGAGLVGAGAGAAAGKGK